MEALLPLFQRAGVKVMFSGHEHNFQHSSLDGIEYFVTGAAGRARTGAPNRFVEAHTRSWSAECHFLLVKIDANRLSVRAIGQASHDRRGLADIVRRDPQGHVVTLPMEFQRAGSTQ